MVGEGEGEKRKSGKKGRERQLQEPMFLYSAHHYLSNPIMSTVNT